MQTLFVPDGGSVDRPLKLHDLRRILKSYGIEEDQSRGKGSHTLFYEKDSQTGKTVASFPVPTNRTDVLVPYVKGCRRRFNLRAKDGVSDKEFYSR